MNTQYNTVIVGGGLTGLTIAHKLRLSAYGHRFAVIESSSSTGGVIRSHRENGFIAEIGPHGFLNNCKESREILEETSLDRECIQSPLINFVRYVLLDGKLRMIPQTPLKIMSAPLIPWSAKFRVAGEVFKKPLEGRPTVAKWVSHRFGDALLPFADAVFTGTYAGDLDLLTIDSVMPGVRQLEKEYGSVIRGVFSRALSRRRDRGDSSSGFTMPSMTSFANGMERLPQRLSEYLTEGKDLYLNCQVEKVEFEDARWKVYTQSHTFLTDNLVLAVPANTAISLLNEILPSPLSAIPESQIVTVVFAYGKGATLPPGFGYLTPEKENRFSLGTLFSSNMFPGRAPADHILFETLIGGRRHPERLQLSDEQLINNALADVKDILQLPGDPVYTQVLRPWGAIPQLEKDYLELLSWRDKLLDHYHGLHICGFGWEGIGLNDMMKHGVHVAEAIRAGSEKRPQRAEVKGVYF